MLLTPVKGMGRSWIYNYMCNQCLSPWKLWVLFPVMARCTRYNIMWSSLSVTRERSVVFFLYSFPSINKADRHTKLIAYAEGGAKHHSNNHNPLFINGANIPCSAEKQQVLVLGLTRHRIEPTIISPFY